MIWLFLVGFIYNAIEFVSHRINIDNYEYMLMSGCPNAK